MFDQIDIIAEDHQCLRALLLKKNLTGNLTGGISLREKTALYHTRISLFDSERKDHASVVISDYGMILELRSPEIGDGLVHQTEFCRGYRYNPSRDPSGFELSAGKVLSAHTKLDLSNTENQHWLNLFKFGQRAGVAYMEALISAFGYSVPEGCEKMRAHLVQNTGFQDAALGVLRFVAEIQQNLPNTEVFKYGGAYPDFRSLVKGSYDQPLPLNPAYSLN